MNAPGLFVVLEGSEGSGKSTLLHPLAARMREAGTDPVVVREPGGTRAAEIARHAVLDPGHTVGPVSELFFFLAARADVVARVIRPALSEGRVVVSDRYTLSTEAYQMAGRGLPAELVFPALRAATGGLAPDLTLILDIPREIGLQRQVAAGKRMDRLDQESAAFHNRVIDFYGSVRGEGVHHLDGCLPPDRLLQAAWDIIVERDAERFGARSG
ncbi:MAG TPA: dTMP kinase [Gemmatimonadales bacterium]|nr:dTMP kinase [Gemmatimonadales bacterium]